jgi:peptidoglycan/xylan/chitin deacetylase (PgdA/CDA1 family)
VQGGRRPSGAAPTDRHAQPNPSPLTLVDCIRVRLAPKFLNLCFHGIGVPGGRVLEPQEDSYWVGADVFEDMLDVIARGPRVGITFDDGNASDAQIALPSLLRHGLHASFFVIAGRCDEPGSLSYADVRELARKGMTVGCHGLRHRNWRRLDEDGVREEFVTARRLISHAAGKPVREAACPFGEYDRRVLHELRRQGFSRVYTIDGRPARPDAWLQHRYIVRSDDTPERIAALARDPRQATDFLRSLKRATKRWR